jgi:hypothetical protein
VGELFTIIELSSSRSFCSILFQSQKNTGLVKC